MAQVEPLYDFPEPTQSPGPPKGRGSLRSVSVLDRVLLTVPVWLQLSINPATALHILQKEPPGSFLVRKSRTSQRNVLCVRLADDSVPSFVQQFGIREEPSSKTLCLETSAISFPDLPRLISFYCVSRDVLRFPLELPEAIAKATSHKELESISHMGIEFWNSHLNVRGPREAPKPQRDEEKKLGAVTSVPPAAAPLTASAPQAASAPQPDSDNQLETETRPGTDDKRAGSNPTLFHEFCPIATRSPRELDYGSGQGALCFINPLFLQTQNSLCRRRMFTRSLKVRISTESSSLLSPPLAAPPPPPLMPKAKRNRNAPKQAKGTAHLSKGQTGAETPDEAAQIQTVQFGMENLPEDSDYMQPSPMISISNLPPLSPSLSPYACPMAPPLLPKASMSLSPYGSPGASPSPYQSPCLSPYDSPSASPSLSPYQSPSPSPKVVPFCLSPFISPPSFLPLAEQAYHTPATPSRPDQRRSEREAEEDDEGAGADVIKEEEDTKEEPHTKRGKEEGGLVLQMNASSLKDTERCSSLEGAAETPPSSAQQDNAASL